MDSQRTLWFCLFLVLPAHGASSTLMLAGAPRSATFLIDPHAVRTLFVVIPGFSPGGQDQTGVYGEDVGSEVERRFAGITGLPLAVDDPWAPNQIASTRYYGDTPPAYYTPADVRLVELVTAYYGGGIPRYALITARYIRHVQQRSGTRPVVLIGVSMGGLVTRWLIEHDLLGLVSDGSLERWITVEGVVLGNWAASKDELRSVIDLLGLSNIDVQHMNYTWIADHLPPGSSRTVLRNPLYGNLLIGHLTSTDDAPYNRALTRATQLRGGALPNDGIQLAQDTFFAQGEPTAMRNGFLPMHVFLHDTHWSIRDDDGAYLALLGLAVGARRVTVRITEAEVFDLKEDSVFENDAEAEVVFESWVYSPLAQRRLAITRPLSALVASGGAARFERMKKRQPKLLDAPIFDGTVLPEETTLRVRVDALEIDRSMFYGNPDPLHDDPDQGYAAAEIVVSATRADRYPVEMRDWRCALSVGLYNTVP